jgi:mevalonate kinase
MISLAKKNAYGAKITGAGKGGCIIVLADEANFEKTMTNLQSRNYDCFSVKIDSKGLDTF